MPLWAIALIAVFTGLASIIFSYFYFLLLNFSRAKILQMAGSERNGAREQMDKYLVNLRAIKNSVVVLEITAKVLFILSAYLLISLHFHLDPWLSAIPAVLVSWFWFVLFCRILPAELGRINEEKVLIRTFPILYRLAWILSPFFFPMNLFRRGIRRRVDASRKEDEDEHFPEELLDAVEEGEREGVIGEDEADMIEGVVELHAGEVSDIMTPRLDMICLEQDTSVAEAVKTAVEAGHSRIPVYEKTRDRIVGIFYAKDALKFWQAGSGKLPSLPDLCRKPFFIPETKIISELLQEFRKNKVHMAVVLDEYGGTAGLVTNEDILEEIVGEIVDEYDQDEEAELKMVAEGRAEVSAKLHLDELNEEMNVELPESDDFNTVGGFIFSRLGKVPSRGDSVTYENVVLTVIDADERRINRVAVEVKNGNLEEQA